MVRTRKPLRSTTSLAALAALAALAGLAMAAAAALGVVTAQGASAASLQQVTTFGSNPGGAQDVAGYLNGSGWRDLADQQGLTVVLPQQGTANHMNKCFNWFQSADVTRGQGEVASIASIASTRSRPTVRTRAGSMSPDCPAEA